MGKTNKSELFKMAWQLTNVNGFSKSKALKTAWLNMKLFGMMSEGIVRFYFQKVDGSTRGAWGTTSRELVPETKGTGRKPSHLVHVFFDTEKEEWRSYKVANLVAIG